MMFELRSSKSDFVYILLSLHILLNLFNLQYLVGSLQMRITIKYQKMAPENVGCW